MKRPSRRGGGGGSVPAAPETVVDDSEPLLPIRWDRGRRPPAAARPSRGEPRFEDDGCGDADNGKGSGAGGGGGRGGEGSGRTGVRERPIAAASRGIRAAAFIDGSLRASVLPFLLSLSGRMSNETPTPRSPFPSNLISPSPAAVRGSAMILVAYVVGRFAGHRLGRRSDLLRSLLLLGGGGGGTGGGWAGEVVATFVFREDSG